MTLRERLMAEKTKLSQALSDLSRARTEADGLLTKLSALDGGQAEREQALQRQVGADG